MSNRHVVARCAMCERPIWTSQLVKLLGYVPLAKRHPDLGFVARSRSPGQGRGWKVEKPLRTLRELVDVAGVEAREQLRKLARQTFQRLLYQELISREDVADVLATTTLRREASAPVPTLHISDYRPGSRVAAPVEQPRLASPSVPPLNISRWKP